MALKRKGAVNGTVDVGDGLIRPLFVLSKPFKQEGVSNAKS